MPKRKGQTALAGAERRFTTGEQFKLLLNICCSTDFMAAELARLGARVRRVGGSQNEGETIKALAARLSMLAIAGINVINNDGEVETARQQIEGVDEADEEAIDG